MSVRLGVVMDPVDSIKIGKDSTFAMLLAAQARGWEISYMEQGDLYMRDGAARARIRPLSVQDDPECWFALGEPLDEHLGRMDVILMRKDPPVDMEYVYTTYLLEQAGASGALVVNEPAGLRDISEKLYTSRFPQCCPPTIVTRDMERLRQFLVEQEDIVLKPLNAMGGTSVFRVDRHDHNISVILETLTARGRQSIMAQRYIPEISRGDKRILLVNGEPVPYALARIPADGETRANLAAGGHGVGVELGERDRWICVQTGAELRGKGMLFVGLDVIGDYLTEINVTSPTCIRELDRLYGLDIAGQLMDCIENLLAERKSSGAANP
jgi:glutathione synthase